MNGPAPAPLDAVCFDGRSARARPVQVRLDGDELVAAGEDTLRWPLADVRWPERTRHGQRVMQLPGGARLQFPDAAAFDAWAAAQGRRDGWVVRLQRSWRGVAVALVLLLAAGAALLQWGVPAAAGVAVAALPRSVDRSVGESTRELLERQWLQPSRLPAARQQQLRADFGALLARSGLDTGLPYRIDFRNGGRTLGPNALALPDGGIVVTDQLVELLADRPEVLLGVLAHEWGHLRHRHGMHGVVQASLLGALVSLWLGDFSSLLAAAPVLLVQMGYSRDFERQADEVSAAMLRAGGVSPAVMVEFFRRVRAQDAGAAPPIAIASHPDDAERVRFFEEAARH
ncbi:MAG: M48 family metallopeptidase [Rubrivivax sp.]